MSFEQLLFYGCGLGVIVSALLVITVRNPVHAALFLILAFFNSAILWLLLEAEFLAITLILVYVGAVMVLFLFVVMMLNINLETTRRRFSRYVLIGLPVALVMAVELILVMASGYFDDPHYESAAHESGYSNTGALGQVLYTVYLYPFEIAAVILLVAIIAAIALTLRRRAGTRHQDPARQVLAVAKNRVRLVDMPTEPKL